MNILLMANHLNTGGITSYILSLSRGLMRKGHKVIVASSGGNCVEILENSGVLHRELDIKTKSEVHPKLCFALPALMRLIKDERIDIIHANTRVTQVLSQIASRFSGKVFVSTCHGFFKTRVFRRAFPCWGRSTIAISRGVKDHLINDFKLNPSQVCFIPNGIDIAQFVVTDQSGRELSRKQWNVEGEPIIGIIARLSDVKGINILIEAVPLIRMQFPKIKLWIVGEGPEKIALERLVEERGLSAAIRFESLINRPADILPILDVFVMPSLQEGLGLSVMEAQAAGIPVVASNVGGLPDLIEDGKTGFLVPVGQSDALAEKIIALLRNPKQAEQMASAARQNIEHKFSLAQMVDKTEQLYASHLSR